MLLSTTRLCLLTSSLKPGEEDGTGDINVRIMSIKTAFKATGLDEVIYQVAECGKSESSGRQDQVYSKIITDFYFLLYCFLYISKVFTMEIY